MDGSKAMTEMVKIRQENGVGRITLNRPDALHALNFSMCETILSALRSWEVDDDVHLVVIDHAEGTG